MSHSTDSKQPSQIETMTDNMSQPVFERLRTAVETGKWPNGAPLNDGQKEHTLQLVMAYQSKVLKSTEHFTVGEDGHIVNRKKQDLKDQFKPGIARFTHDDI
ncbi:MAG: hypothetical protein ACI8WB_002769 [Phenylobacterium sp.]|jgi:uncharacterized protein YeaC (DUF1315 family)